MGTVSYTHLMRVVKTAAIWILGMAMVASLAGCKAIGNGKRIIRVSNGQPMTHPDNIGLLAFKEYIEKNLGDKYDVQIFPNELLGSSQKAIEPVSYTHLSDALPMGISYFAG